MFALFSMVMAALAVASDGDDAATKEEAFGGTEILRQTTDPDGKVRTTIRTDWGEADIVGFRKGLEDQAKAYTPIAVEEATRKKRPLVLATNEVSGTIFLLVPLAMPREILDSQLDGVKWRVIHDPSAV